MEAKKAFNNTVLTFGALYGILAILFTFASSPTDDPKTTSKMILGTVSLIIFISISIFAVRYYKNQGFDITLGKSIKLGVLLGLLGGLIAGIYSFIYFAYINPDAIEQVIEMSKKIFEDNDKFTPEMIEKQTELTRKMFLPMQLIANVFGGLLYGLIGGLLGGLFYKTPTQDY